MTKEEFYGENYKKLLDTQQILENIANELQTSQPLEQELMPIVYYCSRIKEPESMITKLKMHDFPETSNSALNNVYDAVGLRIICAFEGDVKRIVATLIKHEEIEVVKQKDYLSFPKPNGYRSYHLIVRIKENGVYAEIQVRTIAMDFWATLEHQLKYKKQIAHEELIRSELKRCADEIASTDLTMQTIREILKEQELE